MAFPALSAARTACELSGWKLSNLELQKVLYIAHMLYLGRTGMPLIRENFEAWDYGPVLPEVYHKAKAFGSEPVKNVFHSARLISDTESIDLIEYTVRSSAGMRPSKLVAITHWANGAWDKNYSPGMSATIPNTDILTEYQERFGGQ